MSENSDKAQASDSISQSFGRLHEKKAPSWIAIIALAGAAVLVIFQAFAYANRFDLSLGPRVILEPWLLQHGYHLYENIIDVHNPLMPLILSGLVPLIKDGFSLAKLVLLTLISLTTILTFVAGWRKIGWLGGLFAAIFFVLWSPTFGFAKLWYESFLAPVYLFWLIAYQPSNSPRSLKALILFGLSGGVVVLIKQPAAVAFLGFAFCLAFTDWYHHSSISSAFRDLIVMGLAAITPVALFLIYHYVQAGSLVNFLYWTIGYHVAGGFEPEGAISPTIPEIVKIASCIILAPAALICAADLKRRGDETWLNYGLALLILVTGAVTAYPRFEFFHLQAVLPAAALVSVMTLAYAFDSQGSGRAFALGITLALSIYWLVAAGAYYRPVLNANQQTKVYEYSDLVPLAQEIRSNIGATDCVYIFPDDEASSNLYYLLGCKPPKFWILHYSWNLSNWVKTRILSGLEQEPPEWIAYFPDFWDTKESAPEIVAYIQEYYSHAASLDWAQGEVQLLKRLP